MDNLTHSLIGFTTAELALRVMEKKGQNPERKRPFFYAAAFLGANLCDLDFLVLLGGGRLGYLLHHRGHTHTIVGVLLVGSLLLGLLGLVAKWRKKHFSWATWGWLSLLIYGNLFLHLFLDSLNSYGIHPFWPLNNHWFYGDVLFIIEPWLWISLLAFFLARAKNFISKTIWGFLLLFVVIVTWSFAQLPWMLFTFLMLWGVGLWWAYRKWPDYQIMGSVLVPATILLVFLLSGRAARTSVESWFRSYQGDVNLQDIVLTPLPSNPFCYRVHVVFTREEQPNFIARVGMVAPWPALYKAASCPKLSLNQGTATLTATNAPNVKGIQWEGELANSLETWRHLSQSHCHAAAYLKFARVPFVLELDPDWIFGDLRFDRQRGLGFSEIQVPKDPIRCPSLIPPWEPPRQELMAQ